MVNMHQFLCGCGFSILMVAGPVPEVAGCWTGHPGPQATGQRIIDKAATHSDFQTHPLVSGYWFCLAGL